MPWIEVELFLIKEKGKLIGFSLIAGPQTEGEYFCARFPKALVNKTADITIKESLITFVHPEEGECTFEVELADAKVLHQFFNQEGSYKGVKYALNRDGFFTPGFKLTLEDKQDSGERSDPILPIK
jgi:hypothetical protein